MFTAWHLFKYLKNSTQIITDSADKHRFRIRDEKILCLPVASFYHTVVKRSLKLYGSKPLCSGMETMNQEIL